MLNSLLTERTAPWTALSHMQATTLCSQTGRWHVGKNIAAFELLEMCCQDCWRSAVFGWSSTCTTVEMRIDNDFPIAIMLVKFKHSWRPVWCLLNWFCYFFQSSIFLYFLHRGCSPLDFTHILSSTTQTGLRRVPWLWFARMMQTALELVEDDIWKGGVKGGNEAAFQRWFMNCLSFSLYHRPGCSCFGQMLDLITKTEHMCRTSGKDSLGKDSSIAFEIVSLWLFCACFLWFTVGKKKNCSCTLYFTSAECVMRT